MAISLVTCVAPREGPRCAPRCIGEERDVGRATSHVDQRDAQVQLVVVEDASAEASTCTTRSSTAHARLMNALDDVLQPRSATGE